MKITKGKKIVAVVMAILMIVGLMPTDLMGTIAKAAVTDVESTLNFDLSGVEVMADNTTTDFLVGDVPVIANGGVKVAATTVTNEDGVSFGKKLSLGGSGDVSKRAVKLVLAHTSEVSVWGLSTGDTERTLNVANAEGTIVKTITVAGKAATMVKASENILPAGTYYIYSAGSGIDIFDIDIDWTMNLKNSLGEVAKLEAETTLGDFTVLATAAKPVEVAEQTTVSDSDGNVYAKALKLGGSGNTSYRAVKFTVAHTTSLDVSALSGGASDRFLAVVDANGKEVTTITAGANTATTVKPTNIVVPAGTYYMYSKSGGINIYDIKAKYTLNFELGEVAKYEANAVLGDYEILATAAKPVEVAEQTTVSDSDGNVYAKVLKLGGSGSTSYRALKFSLDYVTTLDVYALSGGASDRFLAVVDANGKEVTTITAGANTATTAKASVVTLAPGTYYMYSKSGGINIYDIELHPEKSLTSWADIETPKIDTVTVNEENGNFVVNFTANVDAFAGCEYVMISMMSNGSEVSSVKVDGKATSVEMTPYWNGDYSFTITGVRSGEAYKVGNTVEYKSFKLRLKKPVFRMLENLGGGKVYIDWVDNEYADKYEVIYNVVGEAAPSPSSTTEGNYTISGLTVGKTYEITVVAKDTTNNLQSSYSDTITVTENAQKEWNAAITGSAQTGSMTVTKADGTVESLSFNVKDESSDKSSSKPASDISNTTGKLSIAADASGKISDDEDGFRYYYTMVNPNTENFKLTATFKITDDSLTPDNQTGFGVMATDILGINQFGGGTYVHKYYNNIFCGQYSSKSSNPSLRYVTGYNSSDASNNETAERVNNNLKFKGTVDYKVGSTYTYTLEKTNDKLIGTFNDEVISIDDTAMLSVQEDGSICVGVFSARKVGVEITDIKFTTSESTGVSGAVKSDKVTPSLRLYSTNTVGSGKYEIIYASNVAGKLVIKNAEGKEVGAAEVAADGVARVKVDVAEGDNTFKSVFTPSKDATNLTSYADIEDSVSVTRKTVGADNGAIYVAPDSEVKDGADGSKENPMKLSEVVKYARAGQVIVLKDGEYTNSIKIPRSVCGTADKMITLMAENTGKAVFTNGAGLGIEGDYWHVYGINTNGASGVGIQIYGNYNIVEMCVVQASGNSGIQISRSGSATNAQGIKGLLWPSYNLIKNCESFDNCDKGRNDADGFAAKLTCGEGNKFYGCIGHNNIDDGWDLYAKSVSGEIGVVTIENCVAYNNGWLTTDDITSASYVYGEGNGFKLGGGYLKGGHVLKNSVTFANHGKGITSNSCPDCEIYNCTSFGNLLNSGSGYNVGLNGMSSVERPWIVKGLISVTTVKNSKTADLIPFALHSKDNFIYNGAASYNTEGTKVEDNWFESVDVSKLPTRDANGAINMNGLLVLTDKAPADTGARLDTTSADALSPVPSIPGTDTPGTDTPGTDTPGTDTPGTDTPGTDTPGTDTPGTDTPGTDTPGTDTPGTDTPGTDTPGTDTPGTDTPGTDTPGTDTPGTDTPGTDTPGTDTPGTDTPGTDTPGTGGEGSVETPDEKVEIADSKDVEGEVVGAKVDKDVVVKDKDGNAVTTDQVKLVVEKAESESESKLNQAFEDNKVEVVGKKSVKYYDMHIENATGEKLTLNSGKIRVVFAYPEGTDKDKFDFTVFHLNKDGKLETLNITLTDEGIVTDVTDFSPFALVYSEKTVEADKPDSPQSGDSMNSMMFLVLIMASLVAVTGVVFYDRKRKAN